MVHIFYSKTDVGKKRDNNEDYMLQCNISEDIDVYLVLDGIGGASLGEVASSTAGNKVIEYIKEHYMEQTNTKDMLKLAVKYANRCVYELNKQNKVYKDMGTTISMLYVERGTGYNISIGDTRIYEVLEDKIVQITEDDTYVNALVKDNIISKEEALVHPERHVLLRAVGVTRSINFDVWDMGQVSGKKYLICTDGLTGTSSDAEIFETIQKSSSEDVCTNLVNLANLKGGHDNITVMYIEV